MIDQRESNDIVCNRAFAEDILDFYQCDTRTLHRDALNLNDIKPGTDIILDQIREDIQNSEKFIENLQSTLGKMRTCL